MAKIVANSKKELPEVKKPPFRVTVRIGDASSTEEMYPDQLTFNKPEKTDWTPEALLQDLEDQFGISTMSGLISMLYEFNWLDFIDGLEGSVEIVRND